MADVKIILYTHRYEELLEAAAGFARGQWTQFNMPLMLLGLALFTATLLLQAASLLTSLPPWPWTCHTHQPWQTILPLGAALLVLLHAIGLFSTSFILSEGRMVCFLMATMALLVLYCAVAANLAPAKPQLHIDVSAQQLPAAETERKKDNSRRGAAFSVKLSDPEPVELWRHEQPCLYVAGDHKASRWRGDCSSLLVCGVGLLLCNALLGSMGLVARTGHDAMHKLAADTAHATSDTAVSQDSQTIVYLRSGVDSFCVSLRWLDGGLQHTQELLAPTLCVFVFPLVLLSGFWKSQDVQTEQSKKVRMSMPGFHMVKCMIWLAYTAVAALWICQSQNLGQLSLLSSFEGALPVQLASASDMIYNLTCQLRITGVLLTQPLDVLLPGLVFTSVLISLVTYIFGCVFMYAKKELEQETNYHILIAVVAAPVILVLGSAASLASVLGLLECVCIQHLFESLSRLSKQHFYKNTDEGSKAMFQSEGWISVAEGSMWALISTQLFFCTGHFCEFAGLQYGAGRCRSCTCCLSKHIQTLTYRCLAMQALWD